MMVDPELSWFWICPRRRFRSPTTSPTWSCGVVISTSMIGSRMIGEAFFMPSRKHALAAISNASADESTSWYLPSPRVAAGDGWEAHQENRLNYHPVRLSYGSHDYCQRLQWSGNSRSARAPSQFWGIASCVHQSIFGRSARTEVTNAPVSRNSFVRSFWLNTLNIPI